MLTINRMIWGVMILGLVWLITACGGQGPQEDIAPMTDSESPSPTNQGAMVTVTSMPPASGEMKEQVQPSITPSEAPDMAGSSAPVETTTPARGSSSSTIPADSESLVEMAKVDLADRLGIPTEEITVLLVETAEWSDASLDCPKEGVMYAQVITPGYLIRLQAQGQPYEYHTNETDMVVLCQPEEIR